VGEDTKRVDSEVKQQLLSLKQLQQDYERFKNDMRSETIRLKEDNLALSEQLRVKEAELQEQIKLRDIAHEKFKNDVRVEHKSLRDSNQQLTEQLKLREREIIDLKSKLDREIDWRTRNTWSR
jgi:D-ribose pyranose/furanose isomerase RbsD